MSLRAFPTTKPVPTQAENALKIDKGHLWLHCFRTCSECNEISADLTQYVFRDGSSLVLDSSHDFPIVVDRNSVIREVQRRRSL
ncbi:hypothetical protein FJ444_02530 [Aestuariibacter sp. GS-14]|uniref:hypothetical protein n=1 Tax=Aestuariibacter sp. GS-14 TaxID=2590670 RepID=UPI00112BDCC5|nr:hypothetical protein [Aestuariibacter sp. GS-14]TPV62165.1 hypothetical protein FJ444_02530 [Aestuariibacter sp. GS-14]